MIEIVLAATLVLSDGTRLDGDDVPGWSPRPQVSMRACVERGLVASRMAPPAGIAAIEWRCERRIRLVTKGSV